MNKQVIALIQARGGSKGVPKKNIRPLGGYPLIAWSVAACKLSSEISRTLISTDCPEIAAVAAQYGAEVPFMRPAELASDTATDFVVFKHAFEWLRDNEGAMPDMMVQIRPTTPLRDPAKIDEAVRLMQSQPGASGLRSVFQMAESPAKMFVLQGGYLTGLCPLDPRPEYYNLPRQSFAPVYNGQGYVDIVRASTLFDDNSMYGFRMLGFPTPDVGEVDREEDFRRLEYNIELYGKAVHDYLKENFAPVSE